jgi:hypothetical protein
VRDFARRPEALVIRTIATHFALGVVAGAVAAVYVFGFVAKQGWKQIAKRKGAPS